MKIPKPTDAGRERFHSLVPDDPRVEVKPMFGNVAAFVNGNMFMGLFGDDIGVKLPAEQLESLLSKSGAGPFGPPERPMGAYAALPTDVSTRSARSWIGKSLDYVGSMPPKKPKKKGTKKATKKATSPKSGRRAGGQR